MILNIVLIFLIKVCFCFNLKELKEILPVAVDVMLKASETSVGRKCFQDIQHILRGITDNNPWALQVLGSSGNRHSPYLWSKKLWLGSREACMAANTLSTESPNSVTVDYRILTSMIIKEDPQHFYSGFLSSKHFHLGLCLPQSCSHHEVKSLAEESFRRDSENPFFKVSAFSQIKDLNTSTGSLWTNTSYLTAVSIIVIIGTLTFLSSHHDFICNRITKLGDSGNKMRRLLLCFHFPSNLSKTMTTKIHPGTLLSVEALKAILCFWIILMHVLLFNLPVQDLKLDNVIYKFLYYIFIICSAMVLEIFFQCSGIILTYNFLRNTTLQQQIRANTFYKNLKLYLRLFLYRYFRLAPMVIVSVILSRMVYLYLDTLDAYPLSRCPRIECQNWQWNLLFIQNWFPKDVTCQNWSWYVACDLQLYGIFTLILFIRTKYPRCGRFMIAITMALGLLSTMHHELKFKGDWVSLPQFAQTKFCQRINKISYPIYIFHNIVATFAFGGQLPTSDVTLALFIMTIVTFIGIFTITYFMSIFLTSTVEIPFQKLAAEFIMRPQCDGIVKEKKEN
ncbi:hypothetical protein DMENIID0001_040440 [Sergentomyia squamirostris]